MSEVIFKGELKLLTTANAEPLTTDRTKMFSKLWIYPAKAVDANGDLTANVGNVKIGKKGSGLLSFPDVMLPADLPIAIELPAGQTAKIASILVKGAAGDGVYFNWT